MNLPPYIISSLDKHSEQADDVADTIARLSELIGGLGGLPDVGSIAANINEYLAPNKEIRDLSQGVGALAEAIFEECNTPSEKNDAINQFKDQLAYHFAGRRTPTEDHKKKADNIFRDYISRYLHLAYSLTRDTEDKRMGYSIQYSSFPQEYLQKYIEYWLISWEIKDAIKALEFPERDLLANQEIARNSVFFDAWQSILEEDDSVRVKIDTKNLCKKLTLCSERVMLNKPIIIPDIRARSMVSQNGKFSFVCDDAVASAPQERVKISCIANTRYADTRQSFGFARVERQDSDGQKYNVCIPLIMVDNDVLALIKQHKKFRILELLSEISDYSIHDIAHATVSPSEYFHRTSTLENNPNSELFAFWERAISPHKKYEGRYVNQTKAAAMQRAFSDEPELAKLIVRKIEEYFDLVKNLEAEISKTDKAMASRVSEYLAMMMHRHTCELFPASSKETEALKRKIDELSIAPRTPKPIEVAEMLFKRGLLNCGNKKNLEIYIKLVEALGPKLCYANELGFADNTSRSDCVRALRELQIDIHKLPAKKAELIGKLMGSLLINPDVKQNTVIKKLRTEVLSNLSGESLSCPENSYYAQWVLGQLGLANPDGKIPELRGFDAVRYETMRVTQMGEKVFAYSKTPYGNSFLPQNQITELFAIALNDTTCRDQRYDESMHPVITGTKSRTLNFGQVVSLLREKAVEGDVFAKKYGRE